MSAEDAGDDRCPERQGEHEGHVGREPERYWPGGHADDRPPASLLLGPLDRPEGVVHDPLGDRVRSVLQPDVEDALDVETGVHAPRPSAAIWRDSASSAARMARCA